MSMPSMFQGASHPRKIWKNVDMSTDLTYPKNWMVRCTSIWPMLILELGYPKNALH